MKHSCFCGVGYTWNTLDLQVTLPVEEGYMYSEGMFQSAKC